jgi:ATP-dependent exoDNAse (exonuclease V) alpha subunit
MIDEVLKKLTLGNNLFITGGAGSGKSYMLMRLKERLKKELALTASTGVAALNIGGITIHSFAKLGIGTDSFEKILSKIAKDKKCEKRLLACKYLAIDEISMLSAKFFNLLNRILKEVRGSDAPFGGVTIVLFGDFLQLPPVIKNYDEDGLCLFSESWKEGEFETILLTSNHRQKDDKEFFEMLKCIRLGKNLSEAYQKLQSRVGASVERRVIQLVSHREQANLINQKSLTALPFEEKIFTAKYEGKEEFIRAYLPHFEENVVLKLKKGARVMLNFNLNLDDGLYNGVLGNVVDFDSKGFPVVIFDDLKQPIVIMQNDFLIEDPFTSEVLFCFTQLPLQLAYGVTIHKSQGLTFDFIKADISRCFANGQAYVSLSRAKTLNGLFLEPFGKHIFKVDETVANYYANLER